MKRYFSFVLLLLLAFTVELRAENAVRFSDAVVEPGGSFTIDLIVENDVPLGGLTIPFKPSSSHLTLLLIEAVPERWTGDMFSVVLADPQSPGVGSITVLHSFDTLTTGWIPEGTGPIARITFSVSPAASSQYAFIDSVYNVANGQPTRWVNWTDYLGEEIIEPEVYPGTIRIGTPAAVTMSVGPEFLTLRGESGSFEPVFRSIEIRSDGLSQLDWEANWSSDWLLVSPSIGKTPAFPSASADAFFLLPGNYFDTIEIYSPIAENSPLYIPVEFIVDTAGARPPDGFNFSLGQNRPSPFVAYSAPETRIPFLLEEPTHVEIAIFDLLGRRIRTLASAEYAVGEGSVYWDGRDGLGEAAASGHYICRMSTSTGVQSRVIVLIR